MRLIDADALIEKCGGWYVEEGTESGFIGTLKNLLATEPTIQPEVLACGNGELVAKPEPQWIPCEERMPDDNTDVLLQFESNMTVGFYEDGGWAINTGDGIYSMIGDNEEKPIAWMPLPEPYRKGDSR